MNRKETTELLTDILIHDRLSDRKYYAKEVSIDYGTTNVKRVDVMEFVPQSVMSVSGIEKGNFVCYGHYFCHVKKYRAEYNTANYEKWG